MRERERGPDFFFNDLDTQGKDQGEQPVGLLWPLFMTDGLVHCSKPLAAHLFGSWLDLYCVVSLAKGYLGPAFYKWIRRVIAHTLLHA